MLHIKSFLMLMNDYWMESLFQQLQALFLIKMFHSHSKNPSFRSHFLHDQISKRTHSLLLHRQSNILYPLESISQIIFPSRLWQGIKLLAEHQSNNSPLIRIHLSMLKNTSEGITSVSPCSVAQCLCQQSSSIMLLVHGFYQFHMPFYMRRRENRLSKRITHLIKLLSHFRIILEVGEDLHFLAS